MNIDEAIACVESQLEKKRFEHTLRVKEVAIELAKQNNVLKKDAELAAVFHDYAKNFSPSQLHRLILQSRLPKDLLHYHHELWHGPVGSILIERDFGITNLSILEAIRFHTTGRASMSQLDIVIFVADYIEPGRQFPGVDEVRETAFQNLITAAWMILRNTIQYLVENRAKIYPDTFHAYNDLTNRL